MNIFSPVIKQNDDTFSEQIYTVYSPLLHTVHSSYGSSKLEYKDWVTVEKLSYICKD